MFKKTLGAVLFLLLLQVLGYHLFSRTLLVSKVMRDQVLATIEYPDSTYIVFCGFGKDPSVDTIDEIQIEYQEVSLENDYYIEGEVDSSYILIEDDLAEDYEFVPPPHYFKYSEIPSLSKKEQLIVEEHFRSKSKYVKFAVNEGDYLSSGASYFFVFNLCLVTDFFIGRVEEILHARAPDIGYYESWESTYIWVLFTWIKIDRHGTGIS